MAKNGTKGRVEPTTPDYDLNSLLRQAVQNAVKLPNPYHHVRTTGGSVCPRWSIFALRQLPISCPNRGEGGQVKKTPDGRPYYSYQCNKARITNGIGQHYALRGYGRTQTGHPRNLFREALPVVQQVYADANADRATLLLSHTFSGDKRVDDSENSSRAEFGTKTVMSFYSPAGVIHIFLGLEKFAREFADEARLLLTPAALTESVVDAVALRLALTDDERQIVGVRLHAHLARPEGREELKKYKVDGQVPADGPVPDAVTYHYLLALQREGVDIAAAAKKWPQPAANGDLKKAKERLRKFMLNWSAQRPVMANSLMDGAFGTFSTATCLPVVPSSLSMSHCEAVNADAAAFSDPFTTFDRLTNKAGYYGDSRQFVTPSLFAEMYAFDPQGLVAHCPYVLDTQVEVYENPTSPDPGKVVGKKNLLEYFAHAFCQELWVGYPPAMSQATAANSGLDLLLAVQNPVGMPANVADIQNIIRGRVSGADLTAQAVRLLNDELWAVLSGRADGREKELKAFYLAVNPRFKLDPKGAPKGVFTQVKTTAELATQIAKSVFDRRSALAKLPRPDAVTVAPTAEEDDQ